MNINLPTIILQTLGLILLVYVLKRLLYKPVLDMLDKRIDNTNKLIDKAEKNNKDAEDFLKESREELEHAKQEALNIRDLAKRAGLKEREAILDKSKDESLVLFEKAREEIQLESIAIRQELKSYVADFAVKISEKLLLREMNQEDRKRYIKLYLKEIEEKDDKKS